MNFTPEQQEKIDQRIASDTAFWQQRIASAQARLASIGEDEVERRATIEAGIANCQEAIAKLQV